MLNKDRYHQDFTNINLAKTAVKTRYVYH